MRRSDADAREYDLAVLDYSERGNAADQVSDALIVDAAARLGLHAAVVKVRPGIDAAPGADRVWLRYDIRSLGELDWIVELGRDLVRAGYRVFPAPEVVRACEDKLETWRILSAAGVATVDTEPAAAALEPPLVAKPRVGWGGMGVRIVSGPDDPALADTDPTELVFQPFVRHGSAWTVVMAAGRPVAAVEKLPADDEFRTNERCGATARLGPPPPKAEELTARALEAVGLTAGAADLAVHSRTGQLLVIEINSAPGLDYPTLPQLDLAGPLTAAVLAWMDGSQ